MSLPILVATEFAFGVRLSVKSNAAWEYESLWCRLMKLAYWNGLNGEELAHVLGPEITRQRGLLHRPHGSLWRKWGHYLKDSERTLRLAFPPFALSQMNAVADRLRGCRRCYPQGFLP